MAAHLVRLPTRHWAFVPPLPPEVVFTSRLIALLARANHALGTLAGLGSNIENPHLLIRSFLRREAVLSSRIEGSQATIAGLVQFEASPTAQPVRISDIQEVANYVDALEAALDSRRKLPLSLRLLRDLHRQLLHGTRGHGWTPGEFRTGQSHVGEPGSTLDEASYIPPPVPQMHQALDALEKYLHTASGLPALVRIPLVHYQFEAIHPFWDGNGRIGRLLISVLLCEENLLPSPLLYLSAFFERHRREYYDLLLRVSQKGEWLPWIEFFLRGVNDQAADAAERLRRLDALRIEYRRRVTAHRTSSLLPALVDTLFESVAITIPRAAKILKVTERAAAMSIHKLVDAGILTEVTGRARYRVYLAQEILDLLEAPLSAGSSPRAYPSRDG